MNARLIRTCAALAAVACQGPDVPTASVVQWRLESAAPDVSARPGDTIQVTFVAEVARGWHVYSLTQKGGGPVPMSVSAGPSPPFARAGEIRSPEPDRKLDPNFGIETESYDDGATFTIPVSISGDAGAGANDLVIRVRYQACSDRLCLPARTAVLTTPVRIGSS